MKNPKGIVNINISIIWLVLFMNTKVTNKETYTNMGEMDWGHGMKEAVEFPIGIELKGGGERLVGIVIGTLALSGLPLALSGGVPPYPSAGP
jgi:hypothetical protein